MKPIVGVDLKQIFTSSESDVLVEKTKKTANTVKGLLLSAEDARKAVKDAENNLQKKEQALETISDKIRKVKKGDWSALQDK